MQNYDLPTSVCATKNRQVGTEARERAFRGKWLKVKSDTLEGTVGEPIHFSFSFTALSTSPQTELKVLNMTLTSSDFAPSLAHKGFLKIINVNKHFSCSCIHVT